jgi:hypothetical protein
MLPVSELKLIIFKWSKTIIAIRHVTININNIANTLLLDFFGAGLLAVFCEYIICGYIICGYIIFYYYNIPVILF